MSWKIVCIKDISLRITKGTTPTSLGMGFAQSGINFIKAGALNGDVLLNEESFAFISKDTHNKLKRSQLEYNDVLITIAGENIGKCGLVRSFHLPANTNQAVGIIKLDKEKVDSKFVYYFFKQSNTFNYIQSSNAQAAQPNINLTSLGLIKINLPPLPIQQKIAKILSNYDDLIENNLKRIKLLEESGRLTYEEWFLRFCIDGKKLEIDPATGLPFGWERVSLSDMGEFLNGYAFKPKDLQEEGLPVIKIKEMKAGVVEDTPRNPGDKIDDKYLVLRGDILFSWSATLEVIQWQYANGWLNQHLFKVSPNSDFPKSFLYLSLRNSLHIFDYLTTGATMKHIKRKELDFVKIPTPSSDILLKFDNLVNPMLEEILNLSHQNQLLKEARDILLPRLMTGMIDTDDMDIAV
jgi:type I restriction enzyme, S subunit